MAQGGSSSFLVNVTNRRRALLRVREELLDRPGIPRRGGPPPPTVPAQERTSPQEQALEEGQVEAPQAESKLEAEGQAMPALTREEQPVNVLGLSDEDRKELLAQIEPFLRQVKMEKRAKLHRKIGRSRKFFGGGL